MQKNIGSNDKMIRILVAIIIAVLYYTNIINGTLAIILSAIALILALTIFISFCPLYAILGISTCKVKK